MWDVERNKFVLECDGGDAAEEDMSKDVVKDWLKVHPMEMRGVHVSFDGAREHLVRLHKAECDALHRKLESLNVAKTANFGEKSRFAQVMTRSLEIDYSKLSQFMATFYFAAEFSTPPPVTSQNKDRINFDGYMARDHLNCLWRKTKKAGKGGFKYNLWMEMQNALNKDRRELFLSEGYRAISVRVTLDDDKVYFQINTASVRSDTNYLCRMKACQHVKANRREISQSAQLSCRQPDFR
ncbi:hypothetical protein ACHAWF_013675 [Thalassiosira exigua]